MKTYDERTQTVLQQVENKKKTHRALVAAVTSSAVCVFVFVAALVLFLPYQTPQAGAYQKVVDAVYSTEYRNNWEAWTSTVSISNMKGAAVRDYAINDAMPNSTSAIDKAGMADSASESAGGEEYVENTNLQVAGVKEGDVLKESTHYFYRLRRGWHSQYEVSNILVLDVFEKAGLDSGRVGSFTFHIDRNDADIYSYEMYLDDACTTLTVLFTLDKYSKGETGVVQFDVRDPANITARNEQYVAGKYISSRMVGGRLLLYTYYRSYDYTYEEPETYIPYIEDAEGRDYTKAEDIVCPDSAYSMQFDVLTMFDADLKAIGQVSMLGYDSAAVLYVNDSRAYLAEQESAWRTREDAEGSYTIITCVEWGQSLAVAGSVEVYGIVDNQYNMDEYEGVLRVAATINDFSRQGWSFRRTLGNNASLYCYRVDDLTLLASVERFAPEGESVQSARFVGNKAYICTAEVVVFTDPVYCFDLSDYSHITRTDTGAIDGYSTSLVPFADDTLLGVGKLSNTTIKVELYRENGQMVDSVAQLTLGGDQYDLQGDLVYRSQYVGVEEYKSYLIDAADGVFGMAANVYTYDYDSHAREYGSMYLLMVYRDGQLRVGQSVAFDEGVDSNTRAAVADGYIYIFTQTEFKVVALADLA